MKPPYEITNSILRLLTSISEKIGEVNANHLHKPSPELRKRNRVKTIKASLEIEGNTLSEDQITAILENKRVIGPKKGEKRTTSYQIIKKVAPDTDTLILKKRMGKEEIPLCPSTILAYYRSRHR